MAQLLLSAAGSCELNVVFNVFSGDWSCATRREVHQHYCVVYLAYEQLKIEILVTPLPTTLIVL
jgi:hypothetical protein